MERKTKINAEQGIQNLRITRAFDLPVELLFKAYTEAAFVEQWMGTKVLKLESKKHGSYQFQTRHGEVVVFSANGTIHELIPDQKIVRTFEMENAALGVQLEIIEFIKCTNDTSEINIHTIYESAALRDQQLQLPFAAGINSAHNRLQEILFKLK